MRGQIDELVREVCGADDHPLAPVLRRWCGDSRPFLAFVEAHASKLRKKARLVASPNEFADLLAELAVASLLARDRRFTVLYEPGRAAGVRSPDFGVTFRTNVALNVEVTRLRHPELTGMAPSETALRLARVLCDKIGQCPPGAVNLLAVVLPPGAASDGLVPTAVRLLERLSQSEVGRPSPELRLEDVRAFLRGRQRLSAVALCSFTGEWEPSTVRLWLNPQAKHPLPAEVGRYLVRGT
ncbi:hypothetical protein V3W47_03145 [Deinococcus sp. YIM 134068]|uniref:hypothetical protein n=1 Tax=Deinococcus lichenicola TaxID=3118910 RepID=UPI002F944A78